MAMSGTEKSIFDNISIASGDTFDDSNIADPNAVSGGEQQANEPSQSAEQTPQTQQPTQQTTPPAQQQTPPQPNTPQDPNAQQRVRPNERGDLVDANGNILATRGEARRLYQQAERLRESLTERDTRIQQLTTENQQLQSLMQAPTRLGLNREDVETAYALSAMWKANPVQAVQEVIARALQAGYDMADLIGPQAQATISTSAIRGMLDTHLQPLRQQQTQQTDTVAMEQRVRSEVNNFLIDYPDAEMHGDALNILVNQDKSNDPPRIVFERAYLKLEAWAAQHGYDLSLPLRPQVLARNAAPQNTGQPQTPQMQPRVPMQQNPIAQQPSFPQGRAAPAQSVQPDIEVNASDSWDVIIGKVRNATRGSLL